MSKTNASQPQSDTVRYSIDVSVHERGIRFKFPGGAGIGIRRDNPGYYGAIGEWFCNEVDALATGSQERDIAFPIIEAAMEARRFLRNMPGCPAVFAMLDQLEAALKPIDEEDAMLRESYDP